MREAVGYASVAVAAASLTALGFTLTGVHDTRDEVARETEKVQERVGEGVRQGIEDGTRNAADEILSLDYLDRKIDAELGQIAERPLPAVREAVQLLERLEALLGPERVLEILKLVLDTTRSPPAADALGQASEAARVPLEEATRLLRAMLEAPPAATPGEGARR